MSLGMTMNNVILSVIEGSFDIYEYKFISK